MVICISYRTVPSTIWPIFPEYSMASEYNTANITRLKAREISQQNMRREENIGHIVRDKRAITSLSLS